MAWTEIATSNNLDGNVCYDSQALTAGTYDLTVTWPNACNVQNFYAMLALKAVTPWVMVQAESASSPDEAPGGITSYSETYAGANTAGNLLIAFAAFDTGFSTAACTVSDTAGNAWVLVLGAAESSGGGKRFGIFVATNCAAALAGNTVTFTPVGAGGVFLSITTAIFEVSGMDLTAPTYYPFPPGSPSGANPLAWGGVGAPYVSPTGVVDGIRQDSGPAVNFFSDSIATTQPGDLLMVFTANLPWCAVPTLTGGGPDPATAGEVHGTFTGFIAAGQVGGGTK